MRSRRLERPLEINFLQHHTDCIALRKFRYISDVTPFPLMPCAASCGILRESMCSSATVLSANCLALRGNDKSESRGQESTVSRRSSMRCVLDRPLSTTARKLLSFFYSRSASITGGRTPESASSIYSATSKGSLYQTSIGSYLKICTTSIIS